MIFCDSHRYSLSNVRKNDRSPRAISYYRKIIDSKQTSIPNEEDGPSSSVDDVKGNSIRMRSTVYDALFELSEILESSYRNVTAMREGFSYLIKAADSGHTKAQHKLAAVYATGLYGAALVPMNAGKALLLEYMAALGGNPEASMGMGYRHLYGIGVPENCEIAKMFYEIAANVAADQIRMRGLPVHSERVKISEVEATASLGRRDGDAEVVDFYKHLVSAGGDTAAAYTLGSMYLYGSRFMEQDMEKAIYYIRMAAEVGNVPASGQLGYLMAQQLTVRIAKYNKEYPMIIPVATDIGNVNVPSWNQTIEEASAVQREELLQLNVESRKVMKFLKYAANRGDAHGIVGLGYVHFIGLIDPGDSARRNSSTEEVEIKVMRNISMSYSTFLKVQSKHSDAGFYMGEILMGRGQVSQYLPDLKAHSDKQEAPDEKASSDLSKSGNEKEEKGHKANEKIHSNIVNTDPQAAVRAYAVSSQRGNLLALHRLSHLAAAGVGMTRSCTTAVNGFKAVAERGDWAHDLTKAHRLYDAGDWSSALVLFSNLAAIGIESAQSNAAHLLMKADLPWLQQSAASIFVDRNEDNIDMEAVDRQQIPTPAVDVFESTIVATAPVKGQQVLDASRAATSPVASVNMARDAVFNSTIPFSIISTKASCEGRALSLYAVSAAQSSSESFLRVGDCFYYGCGGLNVNKVEAAMHYQLAGDLKNAHAIFNLGLMHEAGDGVQQDFHLAKRFYDQAAEVDADAKLPRAVAIFLLSSHKSLQLYLGAESTSKLIDKTCEMVSVVKDYYRRSVKQLSELLPRTDDSTVRTRKGTLRILLDKIGVSVEDEAATRTERKGLGDLIALLVLSSIYLFIFRWRKSRRRLPLQHQHSE